MPDKEGGGYGCKDRPPSLTLQRTQPSKCLFLGLRPRYRKCAALFPKCFPNVSQTFPISFIKFINYKSRNWQPRYTLGEEIEAQETLACCLIVSTASTPRTIGDTVHTQADPPCWSGNLHSLTSPVKCMLSHKQTSKH